MNLTVAGQVHPGAPVGVDRLQVAHQVALGVGRAAPVEDAVDDLGAEGRVGPLLQRLGRLHVVVVVDHQRGRVGARRADLAVDDRQALRLQHPPVDPDLTHHLDEQFGALAHPDPLRRDARLPHQPLQVADEPPLLRVDRPVDRVHRSLRSARGLRDED